ncbi:MAG: aldolase [bacterium]
MKDKLVKQMGKYGRKLVSYGFVYSHFGNISVRLGNKFIITRSGCMLDEITPRELVTLDVKKTSPLDARGSYETIVHREIYRQTKAQAIIHIHSPFAVVESIATKASDIIPITHEGRCVLEKIPLVKGPGGSKELALNASKALKTSKGAIIREHGSIAVGKTLEEAYVYLCAIEQSAKVKYFTDLLKKK